MQAGYVKRVAVALLSWIVPTGAATAQALPTSLPPPPPAAIGVNVAEIRYYSAAVPFANLVAGSVWLDGHWAALGGEHQDRNGDLLSLGADNEAHRFLLMPQTGPQGVEIRCTFTGSGSLTVAAVAGRIDTGPHMLRFRLISERGKQPQPWLVVKNVDPKQPMRNLDCRDARLAPTARFRPEFVETLRGFRVVRFMDWQNANANEAVPWSERHTPSSINLDRDGTSIEDMLALTRELQADPWFVVPWNADNDYITRFAQMVQAGLPAGRSVYVEVGNEVWNTGFPVGKQSIKEGLERKLALDEREAGMRRYAERTAEVMRIWEAAFTGRQGLVRVLATQQVVPQTAQIALSFRDTARHVDALSTAAYFGSTLGGTGNTRENSLRTVEAELGVMQKAVVENRRIAIGYGKRYIAYEGGLGLALPAQVDLANQLQHDPAMYDLYRRFLSGWQRDVGDVLCHYNSVSHPTSWGAWGLAEWEDETPAQAPKLHAVRDFIRSAGS